MLKKLNQNDKKRIIIYTIYSLALFAFIFYLDSIPNYSMGIGTNDYDMSLIYLYLPCIYFLHGIISSAILSRFKIYVPLIFTSTFAFVYTIITNLNEPSHIKSSLFSLVNYLYFMLGAMLIYKAIKAIKKRYRKK